MMIDVRRLRGSTFDETTDSVAWRAGVNLWMTSWHRVPAASLPATEAGLAKAAGLGQDMRTWRRVRSIAMHNWVLCDDGLYYHPVVAETALEAWLEKLSQRVASGAGHQARYENYEFDRDALEHEMALAAGALAALNAKSKYLTKMHAKTALSRFRRLRLALPSAGASGTASGMPPALPLNAAGSSAPPQCQGEVEGKSPTRGSVNSKGKVTGNVGGGTVNGNPPREGGDR